MTDDVMDRQQQRELRGTILRTLGTVYGRSPDTVSLESIRHVAGLSRRGEGQRLLQAAIQLLIDLGYAASVTRKADALDRDPIVVYRLTGRGMQLLNGDVEDASICL